MKPPLILLVDDETHILNVLSVKLSSVGFRIQCATDGEEALRLAEQTSPDLVITDLQMPRMDGLALCDRLAQVLPTQNTPVIILTGRGHAIDQPDNPNVKALIAKPFSPREVVGKVNELLNVNPTDKLNQAS